MTAANYISLAVLLVSVIMMIVNTRNIIRNTGRANKSDKEHEEQRVKEETAQHTSIQLALNNIEKSLNRIESEINTVKQDTKENHDQLIRLDASFKSEHKRLDEHDERLRAIEEAIRNKKEGA